MPVTARAVRPTAAVDLRPHPKIGEGAGPPWLFSTERAFIPRPSRVRGKRPRAIVPRNPL